MNEPSEVQLVAAAKGGDRAAFSALVCRYQGRLRAFVASHLRSHDDVFDIVQDTFLAAYSHLDACDPDRPFGPWVRTICRHRLANFLRDRAGRESKTRRLVDEALAEALVRDSPLAEEPSFEALRSCLEALPAPQQQILRWRYERHVPVQEIATRLGQSAASVSMKIMRLRGALRRCMESRLEGASA